jgi:SH3-like domain-containing protein
MLLFLLFFITLNAARQKAHYQKTSHEAIVFTPTLTVKSSPDQASTDLFVIHEGIKVTLLDKIGEWQEIRIANGSIGWLRTSDLRMI